MKRPREHELWRLWTTRLPPLPRALGLANHIARPLYCRRPRTAVTVDTLGQQMTLDPHQHVDALLLFAPQLVDRRELRFLRAHLKRGSHFLDAGAYTGFYSLQLAPLIGPVGRVIAVEPDPATAERLRAHLDANGLSWVQTSEVALSSAIGEASLRLDQPSNRGSRRLVAGHGTPTETLGALMDRLGIQRFDAAKFDLEGCDLPVLEQAFATLPRSRWPRALVAEAPHPDHILADTLRRVGYTVGRSSRLNLTARLD